MRKFLPISKEEIVERGWDQIDFYLSVAMLM